nr:hypothetical protein [Tanacetum cinerariifolium]
TNDTTSQEVTKDVSSLRYIALPNWAHDALLEFTSNKLQDHCSTEVPEGSGNTNPTASIPNPPADHIETLTVETPIPPIKPKKIYDALQDPSWVKAMQKELLQFKIQKVWTLVDCPKGEEGIDYDEVFTPVARIEAIRIFLAYASFMSFIVYQMYVKSAFFYGIIDEEVYVMQPLGFQDPEYLAKVYKVEKAMGTIDQTLFIRRKRGDFILVQVYNEDGIFLSQDKYVGDILKEFGYPDVRSSNTPIDKENPWGKDDIMFAVCAYAKHQVTPKECHLHAVKRIFRYLKGHPKLGLWYPKDSPFELVAYSDSDYGGPTQDRKSTTGGCQFLGRRLISWQCKK